MSDAPVVTVGLTAWEPRQCPSACSFEAQCGDRFQQPAPMADGGDAEFLEVVGGQIGQYFGTDVILAECRLVALQT